MGVGKPRDGELEFALAGLDVPRLGGVPGHHGVAVERDADQAAVARLELVAVRFHCRAVRDEQRVADAPRLDAAVADGTLVASARAAGREDADAVAEDGGAPGLVECDPVPDFGAHGLEHDPREMDVVGHELVLVQVAVIPLVQRLRDIPVRQRDHGNNAIGVQFIDKRDIVAQPFLIDWIQASAERYHARPGDAEAVCFGAELFEQGHVLLVLTVGVAGYIAAGAVGDFARDPAEGVPDGVSAAAFFRCALYLVAVELSISR